MPANIEIKAKIASLEDAETIARSIEASYQGEMHQLDTYFNVPEGRLKLRETGTQVAELIYYQRSEVSPSRLSAFVIYQTKDPALLKEILSRALGIRLAVSKKRRLFLFRGTRIHIDQVDKLGHFLEFESPLQAGGSEEAGRIIDYLTEKFQIRPSDCILGSYADLLSAAVSGSDVKNP